LKKRNGRILHFPEKIVDGEIWGRALWTASRLGSWKPWRLSFIKNSICRLKGCGAGGSCHEEKGGQSGAAWLCRNRPEFNQFEAVINEGGGLDLPEKTKIFYLCQAGEKGACWLRIIFRGTPGHGSLPRADNASWPWAGQ
jgi:hypothetical protein